MARFPVQSYAAEYNPRSNSGKIIVVVQGQQFPLTVETSEEFSALMWMLSKSNVICDTSNWDLELAFRPVGT